MGFLFGFVLVFVVFALVVLLPILVSYFNRRDKRLNLLFLIPTLFIAYLTYFAIYPGDYFYQHDFKKVTGLEFPVDGEILYKSATYPDIHGDYTSVSIVKVSNEFYLALPERLQQKGLMEDKTQPVMTELNYEFTQPGDSKITRQFIRTDEHGGLSYVGLLSDNETVVIKREFR